MGIINQGIFGGVRNKIGSLVGSSWKGIPVLKTKPLSVANPRTTAQVEQRDAMKMTVQLGSQILAGCIVPLWNRFAHKMSGFNMWCATNVGIVKSNGIGIDVNLVMSKGKLSELGIASIVADDSSNTITVTFTSDALNQYSSNLDQVAYVTYNADQGYATAFPSVTVRTAGTLVISDVRMVTGDNVYVWIMAYRPDFTYVSNSIGGFVTVTP